MKQYHLTWEIDLYAENYEDAARQALAIQRDPHSIATVFGVTAEDELSEQTIDLTEIDNERYAAEEGPQQ